MRHLFAAAAFACFISILGVSNLRAQTADQCRIVEFDMTPSDDLQIVVWIEDEQGRFVDTAFITRGTGSYGLGNRPGMMEFNSGPDWPYGRRETIFPIWSHRHGMMWPKVVFQDDDEADLSHSLAQSSPESYFCRPIRPDEALWDATSCATTVHTDKGKFLQSETSRYPPRSDLTGAVVQDHESVDQMKPLNPFDAVSRATPVGGMPTTMSWAVPEGVVPGNYVAWIEVSKEFDLNDDYAYPSPIGIPWAEYGMAYRGQPSVVYQVPFEIPLDGSSTASVLDYAGYGDPDGLDGMIREPDATITSGVAGSGGGRLLMGVLGDTMARAIVRARNTADQASPLAVKDLVSTLVEHDSALIEFIAPSDDIESESVVSYEIRYLAGRELTEDNFMEGVLADIGVVPLSPGELEQIEVHDLLPNTQYSIGIRAKDECLNSGDLKVVSIRTKRPPVGAVDACFIATAAYGSPMANQVVDLRHFRDKVLRKTVLGEILVESYYTVGPNVATWIGVSDRVRASTRQLLKPWIDMAQRLIR